MAGGVSQILYRLVSMSADRNIGQSMKPTAEIKLVVCHAARYNSAFAPPRGIVSA